VAETVAEPFVMTEQAIIVLLAGIIGAKLSERFGLPMIIPLLLSGYCAHFYVMQGGRCRWP
jgi:Kef-type K+ transport system membrane component KefB